MTIKRIDFTKRYIAYFILIPGIISISLSLIFYRYLSFPILHLRATEFCMPRTINHDCDKEIYTNNWFLFRASDIYGHLNFVIGKDHKVLYHTIYRPIDWNPCHHLNPDKTQIIIDADAFKECDINEIDAVILKEQKKHPFLHKEHKEEFFWIPFIDGPNLPFKVYLINADKKVHKNQDQEFNVTFSFVDGAKYDDFIKILDAMLKSDIKIYSLRDLTSSELKAIKKLGY